MTTTNAKHPAAGGGLRGAGAGVRDSGDEQREGTRARLRRQPSPRQLDVLRCIVAYRDAHMGVSPSIRDLMDATGIASSNGVSDHLRALERKGLIVQAVAPGASRGMVPTGAGEAAARSER